MSCDLSHYTRWIEALCERDYGVKEEVERILMEKERRRKIKRTAFSVFNRKNIF
jgi:hypothetical protein